MSVLSFVLFSIAVFALMQFAIVPGLERRYAVDRSVAAIRRIAALTVSIRSHSCADRRGHERSLYGARALAQLTFGSSAARLAAAAARIEALQTPPVFSPVWSAIAIVVLVIALGVYSHRRSKRDLTRVFRSLRPGDPSACKLWMSKGKSIPTIHRRNEAGRSEDRGGAKDLSGPRRSRRSIESKRSGEGGAPERSDS